MRSRRPRLPVLLLAVVHFACDADAPQASPRAEPPTVGAPMGSANDTSGRTPGAGNGGMRADDPVREPGNAGGPAADPRGNSGTGEAPLLCPHCVENPGGQTGDFGSTPMVEPCPMPVRALDAALERRFGTTELRAAATREFSQQLTWGEISEELGLQNPSGETTITGSIEVDGEFRYSPCLDVVYAPATIRIATADGKLALSMRGGVGRTAHELGWPDGTTPIFWVGGGDDLSTARGTLDLGFDPSKVQMGELSFSLVVLADGVYGSLRIRMNDFADEATRMAAQQAAQQPSDTSPPRVIREVAVAQFPRDACDGHGRPVARDEALPELGGATAEQIFDEAAARLGAEHAFDATWLDDSATRAAIELGELPEQGICVAISSYDPWTVTASTGARARSEDGKLDVTFRRTQLALKPYTAQLQRVHFPAPLDQPTGGLAWPDGLDAASAGAINPLSGQDGELAWPPCKHAEPCNPENDADNAP